LADRRRVVRRDGSVRAFVFGSRWKRKLSEPEKRRAKSVTSGKSQAAIYPGRRSHASVQFQITLSFVPRSPAALAMIASRPGLKSSNYEPGVFVFRERIAVLDGFLP
jgi:hypothetical protein